MIGIEILRDPAQAAALLAPGSASGLIEFVEERRKGNCLERVVQATTRSCLISPDTLGRLSPDPELQHDRFSAAYLLSAAARTIRVLALLLARAHRAGKRLATLTLETEVRFADAPARSAFAGELADAITRLVAKYNTDAPGSRSFRLFLGAYPAITKSKSRGSGE